MVAAAAFPPAVCSFVCVLLLTAGTFMAESPSQPSGVSSMFVFGDSLVDPGNNNNLRTLAKSNYPPNGIDFPAGATGRFCNGGTIVDHLCALLGLPLLPPFDGPSASGSTKLTHGVNYASAAAGVLSDTGILFGQIFPMDNQIDNFQATLGELQNEIGQVQTEKLVSSSIFFISIGSNDYLNNYLLPLSNKPGRFTPEAYSRFLVERYIHQLKELYILGARKLLLIGLPPLGCTPNQIGNNGGDPNTCVAHVNDMILQFNAGVQAALQDIARNLTGVRLLYWDSYAAAMELIEHPLDHGFKYPYTACCGAGRSKGQLICLPGLECSDRFDYVFWDPYHPTDAANAFMAKRLHQLLLTSHFLE